jgi:hypothetical protein
VKIKVVLPGNSKILLSFISTSFQAPCQVFLGRLARFGKPISDLIESDIHIDFVQLRHHVELLSLMFILFRIMLIQLTAGHSKMQFRSADRIFHKFRKAEIQTGTQHTIA